jgi:hypothetical protein
VSAADRFSRGGLFPHVYALVDIGPDEHVVQPVDGAWVCRRPDHQRHVCHGNQFDPETMTWRTR